MMQESDSKKDKEAILRDGSWPMLLPLVDIAEKCLYQIDIPKKKRSVTATHYSKQKPLKHDKFSSLNILAEATELCIREKDQSSVKEAHLEPELIQMGNAHKRQESMVNLLSCSYGSWSPLDILAEAAEIYEIEENQRSLSLRKGLPFVPIPKKRSSSVQKPRVKMVQRMGFQGKRVTHKRSYYSEEPLEGEKLQPLKKQRKKIMPNPESENPPPDLPIEFKNRIRELEGCDVKFLMQKGLYDTDVNINNNRLSMPQSQIHCEFLSENEKAILNEREGDRERPCGIQVMVLDPCLREFNLSLKKWGMGSVSVYNLVKNWKRIIKENNLQSGDHVQLWSFRVHGNLCLLLNWRK